MCVKTYLARKSAPARHDAQARELECLFTVGGSRVCG
jgi:hypothetical protein